MVKVSSSDILTILRRFKVAAEDNVPRHIEQVKVTHPYEQTSLVSFRFNKHQYYILFDQTAEDDITYITEQIHNNKSDAEGAVLANPNDSTMTYGLPFKGKDVYLYAVASGRYRLDNWLAERNPDVSRSTWQKHIKAGHVSVNGEPQLSSKYDVTSKDDIIISIPEETDFSAESLPIVYIDDNVIVINKPLGVLTHSKGALNDEFTVADFFSRYSTYNSDTNRPGIVHRLDRATSGIMIGARNAETAHLLQKQFAERKTKKSYIAIVDGMPKEHKATIDLPIGRNPSAPSTFRVDAKGKPAQTTYEVLEYTDKESLISLSPRTGRTHQLRVHMSYIGTPIHGDKVYGKTADRMYLHAHKLEVTIPSGNRQVFEAPIPKEFLSRFEQ